MSSSQKLTCKVTLRQVFICPRPRTPYPFPCTHSMRVYSILIHTEGGGVEIVEPEKSGEGNIQQFTQEMGGDESVRSLVGH
jgi:hypothetical protein